MEKTSPITTQVMSILHIWDDCLPFSGHCIPWPPLFCSSGSRTGINLVGINCCTLQTACLSEGEVLQQNFFGTRNPSSQQRGATTPAVPPHPDCTLETECMRSQLKGSGTHSASTSGIRLQQRAVQTKAGGFKGANKAKFQ